MYHDVSQCIIKYLVCCSCVVFLEAWLELLILHLEAPEEESQSQAAALKDSRFIAKELDTALKESLSVAGELRERLTRVGEDLEAEMDGVRAILTPKQAAKFLVWVSNNGAAMHMLDELWSKNFPGDDSEDKKS